MIKVISIYKVIKRNTGVPLSQNLEIVNKENFSKGFNTTFNNDISNPLILTKEDLESIGEFNKPKDSDTFRFQHIETKVVSFDEGLVCLVRNFLLTFNDGKIPNMEDSQFSQLTNIWLEIYQHKYTRKEFHWALMQIEFFS